MAISERLASARLFFNLVCDTEIIHDEDGLDLPTEGDVVGHIARALEDLHQDGILASAEWHGWQVVITDGSGQTLVSVALGCSDLECTLSPSN